MLPSASRRLFTRVCSTVYKRNLAHYPPYAQNVITQTRADLHPHKDVLEQLYDAGERKYAEHLGEDFYYPVHNQRYNEEEVLKMLKSPNVQLFIDKIEDDLMGSLKERNFQANKGREDESFIKDYPDCLLDIDPFNYIREEEYFSSLETEMNPMGNKNRSTGQVTNPIHRRAFVDIPYFFKRVKVHGFWETMGETFQVFFYKTGKLRMFSRDFRSKGFDHGSSDRQDNLLGKFLDFKFKNMLSKQEYIDLFTRLSKRNQLALKLQDIYLEHFKCLQEGDFDRLLYFVSENVAMDLKDNYGPAKVLPKDLDLLFHFELLENNVRPKIVSYYHSKTQDQHHLQLLVRFDMKCRCLGPPEEDHTCHLKTIDRKIQYAVFERDIADWTSTYVLVNKVPEEDIEYFRENLWNEKNIKLKFTKPNPEDD